MLMSKSRLEKFLYALYSLDSSDLPTPLSRIEELYKCLVTGEEAPIFKPLSRVEKYLMAILGAYDVDSLPNPLSRVEMLLYKLATGDDSLEDFDTFLSEHEELLAGIIGNGGVGGNIDIEYVLYTLSTESNTLYNTAEKPVKSAILKGNTSYKVTQYSFLVGKYLNVSNGSLNVGTSYHLYCEDYFLIPKGTQITLRGNNNYKKICYYDVNKNFISGEGLSTELLTDFTSVIPSNAKYFRFNTSKSNITSSMDDYLKIYIDEDLYLSNEEYIQEQELISVKMPVLKVSNVIQRVNFETMGVNLTTGDFTPTTDQSIRGGCLEYFDINKLINAKFVFKSSQPFMWENYFTFLFYDENMNYIKWTNSNITKISSGVYSTEIPSVENAKYLRVCKFDGEEQMGDIVGNSISAFIDSNTPFDSSFSIKSNILTVNEDVTLRSNGDVYDELNLLTGRLTQRIDENNEVLAQAVVKTVDLSVVDQDGNNTKLKTFNDITHVTLSSEALIPEAELEVATKNEEVLNTMSLEMDDISTTQNALQETSDIQSENVDATMIATTEIYEGLL